VQCAVDAQGAVISFPDLNFFLNSVIFASNFDNVLFTVMLTSPPGTRMETWVHKQALERLAEAEEVEA